MKTSSCKAKGRRACQEVQKLLITHSSPQLTEDDVRVTSSGAPGKDILLSPKAQEQYPLAIEVKNVEKLNIREAYIQAIGHAKPGDRPCVFHTRNRDIMLVTLDAEDFLLLMTGDAHADGRGTGSDKAHDARVPEAVEKEGPGI